MKLTFFLIGFILIFLRVFVGWSGIFRNGTKTVSITISEGNNYTQLKYSGKIVLTDDETGFQTISPGGFVKYRRNDQFMLAEGTLKGTIQYELSDNGNRISFDKKGKQFVSGTIHEIIALGFDAEARLERVYAKGGTSALLNEWKLLTGTPVSNRYAARLLSIDTLSATELDAAIGLIGTATPDHEKAGLLTKVLRDCLADSNIAVHYFSAIETMQADADKIKVLNHIIDKGALNEAAWLRLILSAASLKSDIDKVNTLMRLAPKMPPVERVKDQYKATARMINNEADYNKAMQAMP